MDTNYILWLVIILVDFLLLKKIAKIYISQSNGNSIKTEGSLMWQSYILLAMGLLIVFTIFISELLDSSVREIIFFGEAALCFLNVITFLYMLKTQISQYLRYKKRGSTWLVISSHFLKNVVLIYLLLNYYSIWIY